VIRLAYRLDAARMLTGKELGELAQRMIESVDPPRNCDYPKK
jgi:hypothetical protein